MILNVLISIAPKTSPSATRYDPVDDKWAEKMKIEFGPFR